MELLNILIIEDNPEIIGIEKGYLEEIAGDIFSAFSLKEGISILKKKKEKIDIILLDLNLPDSDGLETFNRIRKIYRNIPIIVVSGSDIESLAIDAVSRGAQDYIVKDYMNSYVMIKAIKYAMERHSIFLNMDQMVAQKTKEVVKASEFAYQMAKAVTWILEHEILDNEVDYLLRKFGKILEADRMLIFQLHISSTMENVTQKDLEDCEYSISHTWFDDKIQEQECMGTIGFPCFDSKENGHWWHKALLKRKTKSILIKDLHDVSSDLISKFGSKSIICVPIYIANGNPWGLLICEQYKYERIWTELEIRNLEILAPLISWVLEKNKRDTRLVEMAGRAESVLEKLQDYNSEMLTINSRLQIDSEEIWTK